MLHVMFTLIMNKKTHFCACASAEAQNARRTCDNQKTANKVCEIKLEEETREGQKNSVVHYKRVSMKDLDVLVYMAYHMPTATAFTHTKTEV